MAGTKNYNYFNVGIGGATVADRVAAYPTSVRPHFTPASKYNVASIQGGINDYIAGTTVAATVYARILSWVALAQADGFRVIVWTLEDNAGTSTSFKNTLNGLITGGAVANNYTVADIGATATMGADGTHTDLTYFRADGVHPTIVGNGVYAGLLVTVLTGFGWA